jgi:hypothetical protein
MFTAVEILNCNRKINSNHPLSPPLSFRLELIENMGLAHA